ncbi:MAG: C40 family peptidase [Gallionella sp.]|nr:C40 family peptidase [Gallionella sp.]
MQRIGLTLLILLLGACATTRIAPPDQPSAARTERMNDVAFYALSLADTPYRYGGNSGEIGFDCSGFVQHVYQNTLGIKLPRTSAEMSRVGGEAEVSQLRPGDLVFFNTRKQPFSHVGIYVGEERFVHSPSSGKAIMVVSMREKYWRNRYNGARRIAAMPQAGGDNQPLSNRF